MKIDGREIGPDQPPYIVAEIGANHGGDLQRCLWMIEAAKASGADAVKLQAYEADTITLDCHTGDFQIKEGPWAGQTLHQLYRRSQTPFAWFPEIAKRARAAGITWFASVFDPTSVDMLEKLGCPAYKIASFELVDLPLIRHAALTAKPMILSTGMADNEEIDEAIDAARGQGNMNLAVLHCVSGYPTPTSEADLGMLTMMRCLLGSTIHVGISDHTTGIEMPIAATALRARIIEKHFTVNRKRATPDATFSLEPMEFKAMVRAVHKTWEAMRESPLDKPSETASRPLRRSLYAVADIKAGEPFTMSNVCSIRPGYGLPPKELPVVLGKTAAVDIKRGTALAWGLVVE